LAEQSSSGRSTYQDGAVSIHADDGRAKNVAVWTRDTLRLTRGGFIHVGKSAEACS
jgi:hypothetical protein